MKNAGVGAMPLVPSAFTGFKHCVTAYDEKGCRDVLQGEGRARGGGKIYYTQNGEMHCIEDAITQGYEVGKNL